MRARRVLSAFVFLLTFLVALPRGATAQSTTEIVIEWNRILQTTLLVPGALPPTIFFTRPYAVLQVAVFDALNSIDYRYREQIVRAAVHGEATREVAAAQAAHDVMVNMFPPQTATFDADLAATTSRFSGPAAAEGARVGAAVARAVIEARANDGWNRPNPGYTNPDLPGYWQPVPPANAPAALVHYQDVTPFVVASRLQFLPEAPPALNSERYATDFNEVKRLGGANSTVRTAEQTQIARLFASVGYSTSVPAVWFNVSRDQARLRGLDGLDTARLFALIGVTQHDSLLTSFSGKFIYGLWRPTTAIREAARDGNSATEPDSTFVALIPTPPYPSYPGNMACVTSASATVLTDLFPTTPPFTVTWNGINQDNVTRTYNSFRQLADEAAASRIYGGIHFFFDHTSSIGACGTLGTYVVENAMRPVG
jgi:hypothetical protein